MTGCKSEERGCLCPVAGEEEHCESIILSNQVLSFISRGYDLVAFVAAGASAAVGLELSATAVVEATSFLESSHPTEAKSCRVIQGDFYEWQDKHGAFDIGYDYTVSE